MSDVTIFAPAPILTVTVEGRADESEIHLHAGGQGVWQARMLRRLGSSVTMCCVLSGETGAVLRHLLEDEEVEVDAIERAGRGAAYLHDRRGGEREAIADEEGDPLGRHELDALYGRTLRAGLGSRITILSGPADASALPADTYRRLAADLSAAGAKVAVDLSGERLTAAVDGGVGLVKVSDEELVADGLAESRERSSVLRAMHGLRDRGVATVVVTREQEPVLLLDGRGVLEVTPPPLQVVDHHGAGDSLFAGVVHGLARGDDVREAVCFGAAAGALNVTRHGLGSGDAEVVARLRDRVVARELELDDRPVSGKVSPSGLAALADPDGGSRHDEPSREGRGPDESGNAGPETRA